MSRSVLDNALTYRPLGGEITVAAYDDGQWAEVNVRDTGSGIASEDLPYVFERFYRADKSRSRVTGGTGLGLAIAKQLVEMHHGGTIRVESTPDKGSEFQFTLPTTRQAGHE